MGTMLGKYSDVFKVMIVELHCKGKTTFEFMGKYGLSKINKGWFYLASIMYLSTNKN